jgi:chromosome segregation ATPase
MHTYALQVIAEKDELLHENVSKVLERDERLAVLQASLQQEEENTNELRQSIRCCDAYIAECEARVFDLEFALNEFMALRGRIENLEGLLIQRNAEALHNEAYIARMDSRIAELHQAMLEFDALRNRIAEIEAMLLEKAAEIDKKTRAVQGAEDRVIELDELFVAQRSNYLSALSVIDDLEKKITSRNDEFFFVVDELSDVRGRLDNLLTWRIVRLVDRYVSKGVGRND